MKSSKEIYNNYFKEYIIDDNTLALIKKESLIILKDITTLLDKMGINYILAYGTLLGAVRHKGYIPWDDDIDIHIHEKDIDRFVKSLELEYKDKYEFITSKTNTKCPFYFYKVSKKNTKIVELELENFMFNFGFNIDIFPFNNLESNPIKRKIKYYGHLIACRMASLSCDFRYPSQTILEKGKNEQEVKKYYNFRRFLGFFASLLPISFWTKLERACNIVDSDSEKFVAGIYNTIFDKSILYDRIKLSFEDSEFFVPKNFDTYLKTEYGKNYMSIPPIEKQEKHLIVKVEKGE